MGEEIYIRENTLIYLKKVNRVEVIDPTGRVYVNWDNKNQVQISMQDQGRTLKIFIKNE